MGHLIDHWQVSIKRACSICKQPRSGWYHHPKLRVEDTPLAARMCEIAATRVRYGFWHIYILIFREGYRENHKRLHSIYKQHGLNLRTKRPRRRKATAHRLGRLALSAANQSWSMDFVRDALFNGKRFTALTLIDNFTKECFAIEVGQSLTGKDMVQVLQRVCMQRQGPIRIQAETALSSSH